MSIKQKKYSQQKGKGMKKIEAIIKPFKLDAVLRRPKSIGAYGRGCYQNSRTEIIIEYVERNMGCYACRDIAGMASKVSAAS